MKLLTKTLTIAGVTVLGFVASSNAQVQQGISFSFTVFNQSDSSVRGVRVTNKDVIENLVGTNVPGARVVGVMPNDPSPDGNGNIGAFLRVIDARGNVLAETDTDTFNIYEPTFSREHFL